VPATKRQSGIARLLREWSEAGPDFLWVPDSPETLLVDQARGVQGWVAGTKPLGFGGLQGTVNNSGTDWVEFPTNVGITANNTPFFGVALVSIPDQTAAAGCFLKIGGDTNGLGFGFGDTTFENTGSRMILRLEYIAWLTSATSALARGLNVVSFGNAVFGSNGTIINHNATSGSNILTFAGGTQAIDARLRINGYTTSRGTGAQVHAVAIFRRSLALDGDAYVNFRTRLTTPPRQLDRQAFGVVPRLFAPRRIWVPQAGITGLPTLTASSTIATGYAVRTSGSATLAAGFAVRAASSATLATGYSVRSTVSSTLGTGYAIRSASSATLPAGYVVRSTGAATVGLGYAIRTASLVTLAAGYAVDSALGIGSETLPVGYAVRAPGSATLATGYAITTASHAALAAGFAIRAAGSSTLPTGYIVRSAGSATLPAGYAVGAAGFAVLAVGYRVDGAADVSDPAAVWNYVMANGQTAEANILALLGYVEELHLIHGLRAGSPLSVTDTSRQAGAVLQALGEAAGTITVTRQ